MFVLQLKDGAYIASIRRGVINTTKDIAEARSYQTEYSARLSCEIVHNLGYESTVINLWSAL